MRGGVALRPVPLVGVLVLLVTSIALIISMALIHVAPPQNSGGASHVAGITNPTTNSAVELTSTADDEQEPAPHEHFQVDHDSTAPPRTSDSNGDLASPRSTFTQFALAPETLSGAAPLTQRDLTGPSLAVLSISRT